MTGSVFAARVAKITDVEREGMIGDELMHGNVPGFLRQLKPVTLQGKTPEGDVVHIVICVAPDYLSIGSDSDFIRIPMGLRTALAVTERFGFVLPTKKMVDAIYDQAEIKLPPQPMPANEQMRTTAYYTTHNSRITEQSFEAGATLGAPLAVVPGAAGVFSISVSRQRRPLSPFSEVHFSPGVNIREAM